MRTLLENNRRVSLLKSDLQGIPVVSMKALACHRGSRGGPEGVAVKCERPAPFVDCACGRWAAELALSQQFLRRGEEERRSGIAM